MRVRAERAVNCRDRVRVSWPMRALLRVRKVAVFSREAGQDRRCHPRFGGGEGGGGAGEGMRSQIWSVSEFQMFWSESWAVRKAQEGLRMVGDAVIDLTPQMEGSFGEGANCNGNSSSCFCFFGFFPLHSQPQEASIIVLFLNPNPRKSSALVATVLNDIHSEGTSHHSSCLLKMLNVRRVTILSTILGYLLIIMCLSLFF